MLSDINQATLKSMSISALSQLCEELRQNIITTVMNNGGHLASNLGAIELTVALHYVFDFPKDKLIFDVGHQCYAHKLLTGRYSSFSTLRKKGGISGFPKREESEYDCYDTGHAGTSVSAALGMAKARDILNEDYNVIALIGDGSFNNGLVYEAFNSLRLLNTNILVIINDNGMSIAPTVGSMHEYLEILASDEIQKTKRANHAKIFERFGFEYEGVHDGNDLQEMITVLQNVKEKLKTKSIILHINTVKGKGYEFCEEHPEQTHGISASGASSVCTQYSDVLGSTMCNIAAKNSNVVAVTAAMTASLGLNEFFKRYPERSVDVGICEEHATILCASMAASGLKPYYAVYSTFLQRSIDEIILDICTQNLPVTMCIDRAGISGADGETHQGVFDLSFLSFIPNLTVAAPKDVNEFKEMLEHSANFNAPLAIRYPKDGKFLFESKEPFKFGKWERLLNGDGKYVILAVGERAISIAFNAINTFKKSGINIGLINARFVKPLDEECLKNLKEKYIITVEDNVLCSGFGSLVATYFSETKKVVKNIAYPDKFISHGSISELMTENGVSAEEIINQILKYES